MDITMDLPKQLSILMEFLITNNKVKNWKYSGNKDGSTLTIKWFDNNSNNDAIQSKYGSFKRKSSSQIQRDRQRIQQWKESQDLNKQKISDVQDIGTVTVNNSSSIEKHCENTVDTLSYEVCKDQSEVTSFSANNMDSIDSKKDLNECSDCGKIKFHTKSSSHDRICRELSSSNFTVECGDCQSELVNTSKKNWKKSLTKKVFRCKTCVMCDDNDIYCLGLYYNYRSICEKCYSNNHSKCTIKKCQLIFHENEEDVNIYLKEIT